jgi:Cys-tRNA(Pro)/Cys-tRNA(Cys) deacylase
VPTLVDSAAHALPEIFVNGGQRGLQLRLKPADLVRVLQARTEAVT